MCVSASSPDRNPLEVFGRNHFLRIHNDDLIFEETSGLEIVIPIKTLELFRINPPGYFDRTGSVDIVFTDPNGITRTAFRVPLLSTIELEYARNVEKYIASNFALALNLNDSR